MKTHVLIISETFPSTHKNKGLKTEFLKSIINQMKIHTIRQNFNYWNKKISEVQEGKAILSVRKWSGKPYFSTQIELFQFTKQHGVSIQKINSLTNQNCILDNGKNINLDKISKNDGLSELDFIEWFGLKKKSLNDLAIIHFTNFKY